MDSKQINQNGILKNVCIIHKKTGKRKQRNEKQNKQKKKIKWQTYAPIYEQ